MISWLLARTSYHRSRWQWLKRHGAHECDWYAIPGHGDGTSCCSSPPKETAYCKTFYVVSIRLNHYNVVIMSAMASQIISLTIVYSTVYSGADYRKHKSSASLAFVRGIHRWPMNSPHKGPVTRKMFHLMTSSCSRWTEPVQQQQRHWFSFPRILPISTPRLCIVCDI